MGRNSSCPSHDRHTPSENFVTLLSSSCATRYINRDTCTHTTRQLETHDSTHTRYSFQLLIRNKTRLRPTYVLRHCDDGSNEQPCRHQRCIPNDEPRQVRGKVGRRRVAERNELSIAAASEVHCVQRDPLLVDVVVHVDSGGEGSQWEHHTPRLDAEGHLVVHVLQRDVVQHLPSPRSQSLAPPQLHKYGEGSQRGRTRK